jgi:hypothetical protein
MNAIKACDVFPLQRIRVNPKMLGRLTPPKCKSGQPLAIISGVLQRKLNFFHSESSVAPARRLRKAHTNEMKTLG